MAWTRLVSGSTAGNISMNIDVNVTSVTRTSNTNVKVTYGIRFSMASDTYTYNSIAAFTPSGGTRRYAFNSSSGAYHTNKGTYYYANTTGSTTTSDVTPFTQNITVTQTQTSASFTIGFGWDGWTPKEKGTAAISVTFPTGATKPTGVSCSISSKTETTVTLSGSYSSDGGASITATGYQYSTDNSTWKTFSNSKTTLSANTKYYFRYYATNSQGTTYSDSVNTTTYDYPYCTKSPNFVIGTDVTLEFYNPLGREFTFYIIANGITIDNSWTVSKTSYTGISSTTNSNLLYATIPNAKSGKYQVKVVYGSSTKTRNNGNTYSITEKETPTFSTSNVIEVVDTLHVTDITGNSSKIIKGHNKITGKITKMTANKYATGSRYVISANANPSSQELSYDDGATKTFTLDNLTANSFTITAYDSRELSTPATKSIDLINYSKPKINNFTIIRQNGLGEYAILAADGTNTHWSGWDEIVKYNSIQKAWFRYRPTGGSYSSWIDITKALTKNTNGSWAINATLDIVFTTTSKYDFQIYVQDLLESSTTSSNTLSTANGFLWRDLKNKRLGINKKPEKELDVEGEIACKALYINDIKVLWKE